jgi:hypothetical protein
MVDLARTEEQMLAEIEFETGSDRERAATIGPWRIVGRTPGELLPTLSNELSRCYAHLPDKHVSYDLIAVVKKGLGNAYRWGNERDQEKLLVVTTVITRLGAVIKIRDHGTGFDVPRVVRDRVFTRKGSGMARFRKTSSVISYADGGRTLLIRFLDDGEADGGVRGTLITAPKRSCRIDLTDLRTGDQVKVKGILEPNGNLLAKKVTVKPFEELAVIEAPLQRVSDNGRVIRLLNLKVPLPEKTEIIHAGQAPAGFDQLRAGQVACLTGTYVPAEGLTLASIKVRPGPRGHTSEVRGRIEAIDHADKTFRVVGITIVTDDDTEVRDSVHVEQGTPSLQERVTVEDMEDAESGS